MRAPKLDSPKDVERAGQAQARMLFRGYLLGGQRPPRRPPVADWFSKGSVRMPLAQHKAASVAAAAHWVRLYRDMVKRLWLSRLKLYGPWALGALALGSAWIALLRSR